MSTESTFTCIPLHVLCTTYPSLYCFHNNENIVLLDYLCEKLLTFLKGVTPQGLSGCSGSPLITRRPTGSDWTRTWVCPTRRYQILQLGFIHERVPELTIKVNWHQTVGSFPIFSRELTMNFLKLVTLVMIYTSYFLKDMFCPKLN